MKLKNNILLLLSIVVLAITSITSVFAWYVSNYGIKQAISDDKLTANGAYYKSGNGTKEKPYVIANARHLYNLAWLQDLGFYDDKVYYFELECDIDMSDLKYGNNKPSPIPAIGIDNHPFVSVFKGNGHTINNLFVASNFSATNCITPSTEILNSRNQNTVYKSYNTSTNNIISSYNGLFGTINKFNNSSDSDSEVTNFTIANAKIESSQNTLVGYICGYVNSSLSTVGVAKSQLTIDENVTHVESYPITKYGIIGDYNSNDVDWGQNSGQGNDWGGSIDIASFAKRINYIAKSENGGNTPEAYKTYNSTNFKANLYYSRTFDWDTPYQSGQYVALMEGTYMPLNINLETATISGSYSGDMGSYYTSGSNTGEPVLSNNTGYIVGKNTNTGSATPRFHNKIFNSDKNGIPLSINVTDQKGTITSSDSNNDGLFDIFNYENISFFYLDTSTSTTYRILDVENKDKTWSKTIGGTTIDTINVKDCNFGDLESGYYNVKHQFAQMLSDGNTAAILDTKAININGIQIFGGSSNKDIVKETYSNVRIHKQTFDSYEMLQGGFNFELEKSGSAKLVIGPYTNSNSSHIFPSLYKVERSSDLKTITSYKKITAIYSSNGKYYSQFSDNSASIPSGATKELDLTSLYTQNTLKQNGAYYIEIPLDSGDYWFGPDSADNKCPYILYFDIGANAGDSGDSKTVKIENIDYTYYNNDEKTSYAIVGSNDFTLSKAYFNIDGTTTSVVTLYVMRSIQSGNLVYYYFVSGGGLSITTSGSPTASSDQDSWNKQE